MNGEVTKNEKNTASYVSPDRKFIATKAGSELFYNETKKKDKIKITDNCLGFSITNNGVWYIADDNFVHRYLFSDASDIVIEGNGQKMSPSECSNMVYENDEEKVLYLLREDSSEKKKIGTIEDECKLLIISDDADIVIWADHDDTDAKIYMYKNGEKNFIGNLDIDKFHQEDIASIKRNGNENTFLIYNNYCEHFYIIPNNGEPIKVNINGTKGDSPFFTENCAFVYDVSKDFNGLYFTKENDDYYNSETVFYVDAKGQVNNVLLVSFFYGISEGSIYYRDTDYNLVVAKINGTNITEKEIITAEVKSANAIRADGSLYYTKDYIARDDVGHDLLDTVDLYVYKKDSSPIKVASEISAQCIYGIGYNAYLTDNTDEDTVYFYKDVVYHDDIKASNTEGHYTGTLYRYSYGDEEPTKIASDVVLGTITSGLASGKIDNNSFTYIQYTDIYNNRIIGDWCYYNGKESIKMAENIYA